MHQAGRTCLCLVLWFSALGAISARQYSKADVNAVCGQYEDLYQSIHQDLRHWKAPLGQGISKQLMLKAATRYTILGNQKGFVGGFQAGKAYVVSAPLSRNTSGWLGHHAHILMTYMHVMLELEKRFGALIPDVEFVLTTSDKPLVLQQDRALKLYNEFIRANSTAHLQAAPAPKPKSDILTKKLLGQAQQSASTGRQPTTSGQPTKTRDVVLETTRQARSLMSYQYPGGPWPYSNGSTPAEYVWMGPAGPPDPGPPAPVMRFCSSPAHADIRQPIFHFYTKRYSKRWLSLIPSINTQYPWNQRKAVLFGRFSRYPRLVHPNVSETYRWGANGTNICSMQGKDYMVCMARQHMFDVAARYPELMDINSRPKIPIVAHAQYKYLVHVDGQGLSSRLDQLLPLGSLIFKEESGYTTYYHQLLKPHVHYIPFWKKDPLDVLPGLAWAQAHDAEAQQMGLAAQQFALQYLSRQARTCYWFKLISEFAKLLTYKPESGGGALGVKWMPVRQFFQTVGKPYEGGRRFPGGLEA